MYLEQLPDFKGHSPMRFISSRDLSDRVRLKLTVLQMSLGKIIASSGKACLLSLFKANEMKKYAYLFGASIQGCVLGVLLFVALFELVSTSAGVRLFRYQGF